MFRTTSWNINVGKGAIFSDHFSANLLQNLTMKKLWKSVKILIELWPWVCGHVFMDRRVVRSTFDPAGFLAYGYV